MPTSPTRQFTLYASQGRVYAENSAGKLIDLGAVRKEGNVFTYRLDADGVSGEVSESIARALADIENQVTDVYLDGQFIALPDLKDSITLADDVPKAVISLADSVSPPTSNGDTPHIF
ncbi:hypothetical protein FXN63_09835 [Pigmentiphaga aceris]|uniref:Uncharacterized protein n=1 Tax=Pigmentiphaga aceris TaxID=1940612 RepID=A0A5C0AZT9_9BURK|nr:hypothetical protein [Pigmentiphaga aceris]QEI06101.1 hypothetical protein FXN63_09835 [Pigmentiphaga aceris]